jgi:hypothetical protein
MFKRKQTGKGKPEANRLGNAAEPNKLSWEAADAEAADAEAADAEAADAEAADAEAAEDLELDLDDEFDDEAEDEADDPEAVARRQAEFEADIQRQAEEFGLATDDPTAIYGPNGESVAAVLEALDEIDPETAERLADAWDAVDPNERDVLDRILQRRHRGGSHQYELSAAEDSVSAWLASQKPTGDEEAAVARIVASAARDAVDAFILDDELDDIDYETLSGPWLEVMGSEDDEAEDGEVAGEVAEVVGEVAGEGAPDSEGGGEFGPNTPLLMDMFERLRGLTIDDLVKIERVWKATDREDRKAAHRAVEEAVREDRAWRDQVKVAQEQVVKWASVREGRQDFVPPLVDCVAALVLADILEPEDAQTLYEPWAAAVGEPKLPTYEDDADGDEE